MTTKRKPRKKLTGKRAVKIRIPLDAIVPVLADAVGSDPALVMKSAAADIVIVDRRGAPVARWPMAARAWSKVVDFVIGT